jgi:predicted RNA-binding Zn ribbon-like protein
MNKEAAAPDQLDLVIDFVNTLDIDAGSEQLSDPAALARWLSRHRLMDPAGALSDRDLEAAIELRETLRRAMVAHNGGEDDASTSRELEEIARRGELGVHFAAPESVRLAPGAGGVDGALAALLVPVAHAIQGGSWRRAKACRAPNCQWAFYDRSRNRSATWCDMAVCGNRTKVRAYRARSPATKRRAS